MSHPTEKNSAAPSWIRRSPFGIFFPLGAVAGVLGVGPWILWPTGGPVDMVVLLHVTLQSQAFLAFFAVGFLLTAFPRFAGAEPAAAHEILAALAGACGLLVFSYLGWWEAAQISFLLMLGVLPLFALRRLRGRTKSLPPSFLLLGFGFLCAVLGAVFIILSRAGAAGFDLYMMGRRMLGVGFLLCLVLGVTAKLGPFLTGHGEDPRIAQGKRGALWPHALAGAVIFASFWALPGRLILADGLRALVATVHLFIYAGIGRLPKKRTATAVFFWHSCFFVAVGLWLAFLFPMHRTAGLHITFIAGFSLMIFSFALLVTLSHTGQARYLNGPLVPLRIVGVLVLAAAGLRFAADFYPDDVLALLHAAAGVWTLACAIWLGYAVYRIVDAPPEPLPQY